MEEQARVQPIQKQRQFTGRKEMNNDFGFSVVAQEQLEPFKNLKDMTEKLETKIFSQNSKISVLESRNEFLENKLKDLRDLYQPLLTKLKNSAAPDVAEIYIKWPNRFEEITEFEDTLDNFVKEALKK